MKRLALFAVLWICFFSVRAETIRFKPTVGFSTYAVRDPVLKVKPGDTVETETMMGAFYTEKGGAYPGEVGPFYVEGATREDTLVVKILKLRPNRDLAVSLHFARMGTLASDKFTPTLTEPYPEKRYLWRLDRQKNTGHLDVPESRIKSIDVPLAPMLGRIATAPAGGEAINTSWPREFGGNMDAAEVAEGVTLYLPIFNDGAYFYFGDAHGRQGDGEICGTGLETTVDVTFQFEILKGKKIAWPRFDDGEYLMVAGSFRPLQDAFRIAHFELIGWLVQEYGFEKWDALQVVSQLAVTRVANVVDPNYTIVAKFPKKYLGPR